MDQTFTDILGFIAGGLTTVCFVPQIIKIMKTRETKDISLYMYVILCIGIFMWLVYGLLIKELPIIYANSVAFILCLYILITKLVLESKRG